MASISHLPSSFFFFPARRRATLSLTSHLHLRVVCGQPDNHPTSLPASQTTKHPVSKPASQPTKPPTTQQANHPACQPLSRQPARREPPQSWKHIVALQITARRPRRAAAAATDRLAAAALLISPRQLAPTTLSRVKSTA